MVFRKLFNDSIATVLSQFVSMLVPLCIIAVSSKVYGTEVLYANLVTLSIMGFLNVVNDAGLYQYYVKCISEDRHKKNKLGWWISVALGQRLLTCMICLFIVFLLTFFDNYKAIINYLMLGTVGAVFQAFLPIWFYNGIEKMSIYAAANIFVKISSLLLMYLMFTYYENNYIPVICFTFSNIILTVYLFFEMSQRRFTYSNVTLRDVLALMFTARIYTLSRMLTTIASYLIVLVVGVNAFSLAGIFAIADQIYKAIKLSISPIVQVIIPYCMRTRSISFITIFSLVIFIFVAVLYSVIGGGILFDFVYLIWGDIPENNKNIIYLYVYAGLVSMLNAILGFPWFAVLGCYDKANNTLIWASFISMMVLLYSFYYNISLLAYVIIISELSLLILRVLHLTWLQFKPSTSLS
jgi:PST family polysaccharide transporter